MQLLERILFPTDFGESANVALESVITIAKKFDSEIILLHVFREETLNQQLKDAVQEKMKVFSDVIEEAGVNCTADVVYGDYASKIIEIADRMDVNLILLGAGNPSKGIFKLGSNSTKIIRNSTQPVWVIEKNKPVATNTVLCPVDFSEESKIALDNAVHLCRRFGSKLIVLHVIQSLDSEYKELGVAEENADNESVNAIPADFDDFLKGFNLAGVEWEKQLRLGDPTEEIVDTISSFGAGLVIMGSAGKSGWQRFFVGSVAEKVTQQVPCSFIISKSESLIQLKLEKELKDIDAIYDEGVQLAKDGYTKKAIASWKRCTGINEFYLKAWGAIATAYESLGDEENAKLYSNTKARIQRSIWDQQVEADLRGKHHLYK
jgi:universal stress protein E